MTEFRLLALAAMRDPDAAGAFADWLDEHDRPREAKLLRARWRRWSNARRKSVAEHARRVADLETPWHKMVADLRAAGCQVDAKIVGRVPDDDTPDIDGAFVTYIYERFVKEGGA